MKEQVLSLEQLVEISADEKMVSLFREYASMVWEFKGADLEHNADYYNLEVFDYDADMLDAKDKPTLTVSDITSLLTSYNCDVRTSSIAYMTSNGKCEHTFSVSIPKGDSYTYVCESMIDAAFNALKRVFKEGIFA